MSKSLKEILDVVRAPLKEPERNDTYDRWLGYNAEDAAYEASLRVRWEIHEQLKDLML